MYMLFIYRSVFAKLMPDYRFHYCSHYHSPLEIPPANVRIKLHAAFCILTKSSPNEDEQSRISVTTALFFSTMGVASCAAQYPESGTCEKSHVRPILHRLLCAGVTG